MAGLARKVEQGMRGGFTSTTVLSEAAHPLMLMGASQTFGWP